MKLIEINKYPVKDNLDLLLKDKTTKENVIFATDHFPNIDKSINEKTQITEELINKMGELTKV